MVRGEVPVMTGPGGEMGQMAAGMAGRGAMRTSRAEREQVIEVLKVAFVQDRLAKDEFEVRTGQALTARTAAELATLTADIPVAPAVARPKAQPPAARIGRTGVRTTMIAAAALAVIALTHPDNIGAFLGGLLAAATVVVAPVVTMVTLLHQQRRRQRPAKAGQNEFDSPHLVLLVLTIAVSIVIVLTAFK